jgi:putative peptidoglycan lipid II flippase
MAGTLRSSASISVAVLTSRILGLVREAMVAAAFGVSALTDAYVIAFRIPNLLRDLFAEGALSSAFVPTFTDSLVKGGTASAYRLANLVFSALLLVTGTLTLLGVIFAEPLVQLISLGFAGNATKVIDATLLTRVMMPILLLISVSAVWMGMLNAQRRYLVPAFAPALFNVTSIVSGAAIMIVGFEPHRAILLWSVGTTLAGLVQTLVQLPSLWRLGYRPGLILKGMWRDPSLRRIAGLMGPSVVGLAAVNINVFVNTQFASKLGDGPATYLNNAFRLFYLPIGIFGVALATVTTTRASTDAATGNREGLVQRVVEGTRAVWMLAVPSAVGLIVLAEPVVALLFQRGRFTAAATAATVPVVQAYMLGVLPYSLVKVLSPAYFAAGRPRIPMLGSIVAVLSNIVFSALTYRHVGAAGLALGTTFGAVVNVCVLQAFFTAGIGPRTRTGWGKDLGIIAVANGALGLVTFGGWRLAAWGLRSFGSGHGWAFGVARAGLLFGTIGVAFIVYAGILRLFHFAGAEELWHLPSKIFRRLKPKRS